MRNQARGAFVAFEPGVSAEAQAQIVAAIGQLRGVASVGPCMPFPRSLAKAADLREKDGGALLLTFREAAPLFGTTEMSLRQRFARGQIPWRIIHRSGTNRVRFIRSKLIEYLEQGHHELRRGRPPVRR